MISAQPLVLFYVLSCGFVFLLAGMLCGYALCRWLTDRKLRSWLTNYGKPEPVKVRRALWYYI